MGRAGERGRQREGSSAGQSEAGSRIRRGGPSIHIVDQEAAGLYGTCLGVTPGRFGSDSLWLIVCGSAPPSEEAPCSLDRSGHISGGPTSRPVKVREPVWRGESGREVRQGSGRESQTAVCGATATGIPGTRSPCRCFPAGGARILCSGRLCGAIGRSRGTQSGGAYCNPEAIVSSLFHPEGSAPGSPPYLPPWTKAWQRSRLALLPGVNQRRNIPATPPQSEKTI